MTPITRVLGRRILVAAGVTLPAALVWRKLVAAPHDGDAASHDGAAAPHDGAAAPPRASLPGVDTLPTTSTPVPDFSFTTAEGETRTLKDFAGKGVVLNFWATWCLPCVAEMPALAKLATLVDPAEIAILPLSSDRGGADAVRKFYAEKGIAGLPVLLDPRGDAMRAFGSRGIPTTILIDATGRERARLEGGADWADPAAVAAVKELAKG